MTGRDKLLTSIAIVFFGVLLFLPFPSGSLWSREAVNSGHVILFVVVSWLLFYGLRQRFPLADRWRLYALLLVVGLLIGAAIECLQMFVQREASWSDWLKNLYGLLAGIAFLEWWLLRKTAVWWRQALVLSLFAGILVASLFSFILLSLHYLQRGQAFPVIMDFNAPWATSFVRFDYAEKLSGEGEYLDVLLTKGPYPGVHLIEVEPDWTGYERLALKVYSSQVHDINLVLRVNDRWHNQHFADRFNRRFVIRPGENRITVALAQIEQAPKSRKMDMKNIEEIKIFVPSGGGNMVMGIGAVYLQ